MEFMSYVLRGSPGPLGGELVAYERVDGNIQQQLSCSVISSETQHIELVFLWSCSEPSCSTHSIVHFDCSL